jgi:hypothetical protein
MELFQRVRTTVMALIGLALTVLIRRQLEGFPDPDILNIFNIVTLFITAVLMVMIVKAWLPGR